MTAKTLDEMLVDEPNFIPAAGDILYAVRAGVAHPLTVDNLAVLINGNTVAEASQPTVSKAVVRPVQSSTWVSANTGPMPWDEVIADTESFFTSGASTRLTVPSGVTQVELSCCIAQALAQIAITTDVRFCIYKNGIISDPVASAEMRAASTATSYPVTVVAGDYFEVVFLNDPANFLIDTELSWFSIKVLERTA